MDAPVDQGVAADPLLDAAIACFAAEGAAATLRGIGSRAGVSAALLVKRFGSKDGLRAACDEVVLARIVRIKEQNVRDAARGSFLSHAPGDAEQSLLVRYVIRAIVDGTATSRDFIEAMVDDAERYIALAVDQGVARPSRDERARARYLTLSGLGAVHLESLLDGTAQEEDPGALMDGIRRRIAPPMLELFTHGFFTDGTILEDYLLFITDPPTGHAPPPPEDHPGSPFPKESP
ncbi:TetR/AcrR family transcriptional regulator [Brachybacterium hainanense]|uniref:TetR family transcriptional regulator n=1 Tax=Brachybacterium hainanense TaxID=1541174 RepID=A0ABV6RCC1_9MICO